MLLGMLTTAATFYGLAFVDFPSLQQLGLLIGHSMVICGVLTLVLVPALLPRRPPGAPAAALVMPRLAAWIVAAAPGHPGAAPRCRPSSSAWPPLRLHVNPTLDRLRSVTDAARLEERIGPAFGLPGDVYVVLAEGARSRAAARDQRDASPRGSSSELPGVGLQPPTRLLPSQAAQAARPSASAAPACRPTRSARRSNAPARPPGFTPGAFEPFVGRDCRGCSTRRRGSPTTDYVAHGLGDLVGRFIVRDGDRWLLATYVFPTHRRRRSPRCKRIVDDVDPSQTLTGLPLVNAELARRFLPEFIKGLAHRHASSSWLLVVVAFRDWRLSLLRPAPDGRRPRLDGRRCWRSRGVELDLFAVFAVVTFVGIGVDYGMHLVHRYQERGDAARATAELAPVILVAAAITLLGYGTLITSSYPPLRSIGVVSAVSVVALAAASVLVLPALLCGRREMNGARRCAHSGVQRSGTVAAVVRACAASVDARARRGRRIDRRDGGRARARPAPRSSCTRANLGKGHAVRAGLARVFAGDFTHVLLLDGDMQHLPAARRRGCSTRPSRTGADVVIGERQFSRAEMPASRYHANRIGSRALSCVRRRSACATRSAASASFASTRCAG